ncbi:RING-H2 finger protein ATL48-like [Syzygium oleosum]|uniref:RING-H2 finger protein ATL48-like n=1 Tax=Syzygium oleosum TaxID=219896 RepID=UPI0024B87C09|nr:RING-H2 finger protein ATL48-like [Syzygium oleosum]
MQVTADSEVDEKLFDQRRRAQNPLVPAGAFVTAGVLAAGLMTFQHGDSHLGQKLMRARVVAQGVTVALMVQGVTVALMVCTAYYCAQKSANH